MNKKLILILAVVLVLVTPVTLMVFTGVQNDNSNGSNEGIDQYIRNFKYDPDASVALRTTCKQLPSNYSEEPGKTITVYYKLRDASNNGDGVLVNAEDILSVAYPGALLVGDSKLADNTPTQISLNRAPITMNISLGGLESGGAFTVDPSQFGNVNDAIVKKCDEWAETGKSIPSAYTYSFVKAESQKQLQVKLGVTAKQLQGLNIGIDWTSKSTETTYVVKFTQVYYTVSVKPLSTPSDYFDGSVSLSDVQNCINNGHQAVVVSNVVYGRTILASITSNESNNQVDAAIKAAIKGSKESLSANYKKIISETETKVFVYGGKVPESGTLTDIFEVKNYIKNSNVTGHDIDYAKPISYKTCFIDNGAIAACKSTAMYNEKFVIETQSITFSYYFHGAFLSKCKLTYWTFDKITVDNDGKLSYVNPRLVAVESGTIAAGNRYVTSISEKHMPVLTLSVMGVSCKDVMVGMNFTPIKTLHYEHWGTVCAQHIKVLVDGEVKYSR